MYFDLIRINNRYYLLSKEMVFKDNLCIDTETNEVYYFDLAKAVSSPNIRKIEAICDSADNVLNKPAGLPYIDRSKLEALLSIPNSWNLAEVEYKGKEMYATYDAHVGGFVTGFCKAKEIFKFTEEEMQRAIRIASGADELPIGCSSNSSKNIINYIKNVPAKWIVNVETEWNPHGEHCEECGTGFSHLKTPCDNLCRNQQIKTKGGYVIINEVLE